MAGEPQECCGISLAQTLGAELLHRLSAEHCGVVQCCAPEFLVFGSIVHGSLDTLGEREVHTHVNVFIVRPEGPDSIRAAAHCGIAGASVLALQRMLGHDKPSTTLDVHSDHFDEDLDLVADRLAEGREKSTADWLRTVEEEEKGQDADKAS